MCTVLLYSRVTTLTSVNEARKRMFAFGNRQLENIPPTQDALVLHVMRAMYQAGQIWGQILLPNPHIPSPERWGWRKDGDAWSPLWTTLAEAAKSCRELIKCKCKRSNCKGRCKCYKSNLPCTQLCACAGQCE